MKFTATKIESVWIIEMDRQHDERGWFARTFCESEFSARGLVDRFPQCSVSFNRWHGTLRGMHMQTPPHAEAKLVRCTRGTLFDVALDLRPGSPTHCGWVGIELSAENGRALYIPEGCAHGFQTLEDNTEVLYQISTPYHAPSGRGWRWDDPAFGIGWPLPKPSNLSPRDAAAPDFHDAAARPDHS